jgi:hypothetical protein
LQQLARGEADHLLVPEEPEFSLSETTALDSPLEMLDSLLFVLSPMLEAILHRAMERAYALRTVRLTLQLERAEPHTVQVRPATPTQNRETLLKLLNLELQAHPPQAGILAVTLEAEAAQPQTAQCSLFQAQFPEPTNSICCSRGCAPSPARILSVHRSLKTATATVCSPWRRSGRVFGPRPKRPLPSRLEHFS